MKKLVLLIAMIITSIPCFAGGIGYINYEKVAANYQFARKSMQEIEAKGMEIQKFIESKEAEYDKIESPIQKKKFQETAATELKTKEIAFNTLREKREEEVYNRIHAVAEKIRLERNLDILIDARGVFSGGIDITDALIQKLNSTNTK